MIDNLRILIRLGAFYILFGVLPVAAAFFFADYTIDQQEAAERTAVVASMRSDLADLQNRFDPKTFYAGWFEKIVAIAQLPRSDLQPVRKHLERWGEGIDLFRFQDLTGLATMTWRNPDAPCVMRILWEELCAGTGDLALRPRDRENAINLLLGTDFRVQLLEAAETRGLLVRPRGSDGLLFWKGFGGGKGLICAVWQMPGPGDLLRRCRRLPLQSDSVVLARQPGGSWRLFGKSLNRPRMLADQLSERFQVMKEAWVEANGLVWISGKLGETELLICRPTPAAAAARLRQAIRIATLIAGIILLIFWYRWLVAGADIWVSVRTKLILLFLFVNCPRFFWTRI